MSREEVKQASLDNFGENTLKRLKETTIIREYEFTEPLRKCSKCKTFKPLSEFDIIKARSTRGIKKYRRECKECAAQESRRWHENNQERVKATSKEYYTREEVKAHKKERDFLYMDTKTSSSGFFVGTGSCLLCGEFHPLVLENHHLYPQYSLVISLCANCHRKFHAGPNKELHMQAVLRAIEGTSYLWKDIAVSKNVPMFKPEDAEVVDVIETFDGKEMEVRKK